MIAVIADDLTGAAEIGGIGVNHNLSVEINTEVNPSSTADLLIINTDSRSKPLDEAIATVTKVCKALRQLSPQLIYKKIDSVLRGHVLAEIEAELKVLDLAGTVIVPANPMLGRTLVNAIYHVHGVPVHETSFADDPEFPIVSAHVLHMIKAADGAATVKKHSDKLPENAVIIGEVEVTDDLALWAAQTWQRKFLVGAAGFFSALLDRLSVKKDILGSGPHEPGQTRLYVSGTTFIESASRVSAVRAAGGPVSYMPLNIATQAHDYVQAAEHWSLEISRLLDEHGKAIIAIDQSIMTGNSKCNALSLRNSMALVVKKVLEKNKIEELIIEGGSTAAAILKSLEINVLLPVEEMAPGVIRNKTLFENLYVTLKPGSYNWSEKIWNF